MRGELQEVVEEEEVWKTQKPDISVSKNMASIIRTVLL